MAQTHTCLLPVMKLVYPAAMDTNGPDTADHGFDRQVGALLGRLHESASIVDGLMAMPLPDDASPEWNAAVSRRLERKLADAMRAILEVRQETLRSA